MNTIFKKISMGIMLILCLMFFSACSNSEENNNDSANEQSTTIDEEASPNNEEQIAVDDSMENDEIDSNIHVGENDVPSSEFIISELSIGSFFLINDLGIGSNIENEVMETLSEFDVVGTGDGAKLTLPEDILFDFDSDELRSEADTVVDKLVQAIEKADDEVTIVGHTDSRGEDDYNQKLSENRAEAVRQALIESGIEDNLLHAEGMGATEPVAKNTNSDGSDNPEGRQKNRRVEITMHGF